MHEEAKEVAAQKALDWIEEGMVVGLGTGSTTAHFIRLLAGRVKEGLRIQALASSNESEALALKYGIPLLDPLSVTTVDLTVDGADEIDRQMRMIKGGGGALLREKILAHMSREMLVIADSSKCVTKLGKRSLPVEIVPYGAESTRHALHKLGYKGTWRETIQETRYFTDNHNYILDIHFDGVRQHPEKDDAAIQAIPGVVDTGFFFNLADRAIIGYADGKVEEWN